MTYACSTDISGLLEVANVERLLSLMAAPSCDLSTTESLTLALQEVLAAQQVCYKCLICLFARMCFVGSEIGTDV
jgi:hypothetical protein